MSDDDHCFATDADGVVSLKHMGPIMLKRIALHMARACGADLTLAALARARAEVLAARDTPVDG